MIEYGDWFDALVIDEADNVILLDHWRQGIGAFVREIVGGHVDDGETPDAAARRELREETGYEGGVMYGLGAMYANPSQQNNKKYSYLAVGGTLTAIPEDEVGADFVMRKIPFDVFARAMREYADDPVMQALHISTIWMAFEYIRTHRADTPQLMRLNAILDGVVAGR